MSMEFRIRITGELPLPDNAFDAARLTLAVEEQIKALGKLLGDNGGGMVDECRQVTPRKRRAEESIRAVTEAGLVPVPDDPPMTATEIIERKKLACSLPTSDKVTDLPPDDLLYIPQFLKGGAP